MEGEMMCDWNVLQYSSSAAATSLLQVLGEGAEKNTTSTQETELDAGESHNLPHSWFASHCARDSCFLVESGGPCMKRPSYTTISKRHTHTQPWKMSLWSSMVYTAPAAFSFMKPIFKNRSICKIPKEIRKRLTYKALRSLLLSYTYMSIKMFLRYLYLNLYYRDMIQHSPLLKAPTWNAQPSTCHSFDQGQSRCRLGLPCLY